MSANPSPNLEGVTMPGLKFVLGIRGTGSRRRSEVQSVLFEKNIWNVMAAKQWLRDHGYAGAKVDEGGEHAGYYRFRQKPPGRYKEFRIMEPGQRNPEHYPFTVTDAAGAGKHSARNWPTGLKATEAEVRKDYDNWLAFRSIDPQYANEHRFWTAFLSGFRSYFKELRRRGRNPAFGSPLRRFRSEASAERYAEQLRARGVTVRAASRRTRRRTGSRQTYTCNPVLAPREQYRQDLQRIERLGKHWVLYDLSQGGKAVRFPSMSAARRYLRRAEASGASAWDKEHGRRNPEAAAADLYEEFHGRPSSEIQEHIEELHYHENLTGLGELVQLKVQLLTAKHAELGFDGCGVTLASSEDGKQLFFVGGDQSLPLDELGMDSDEWVRDSMAIGLLNEVTYRTEKGFDGFKMADYFHKLGEESGSEPILTYDTRNRKLSVVGGQYHITGRGIEN